MVVAMAEARLLQVSPLSQLPARSGLDDSAPNIKVTWPNGSATLRVGKSHPAGLAWLADIQKNIGGPGSSEMHRLLVDGDPVQLRSARLFDRSGAESDRVIVQANSGTKRLEIVLQKKDGRWSLIEPIEARADNIAVADFLEAVARLEHDGFVDDSPQDLSLFGLTQPAATIAIRSFDISKGVVTEEILEIGGGPGSLSRSILDAGAKKLTIIEKDRRCILALQELKNFYGNRLEIIEGDALEIIEDDNLQGNFNKLFGDKQFKIIANLPYNIGTPLLFKFLNFRKQIISMHLMLQKEVVQRIVAKAGEDSYGRLAVMVNFLCNTKMLFTVDKNVFTPPPKITSAIVEIIPKSEIDEKVDLKKLQKVVAFAFNQRRKMIKSALKNVFFEKTVEILESCNINPQDRAEQLSIADFCNLAKNLNDN